MGFKVITAKAVVMYSKFLAFSFTSEKSHTYCRYTVKKKNWKISSRPGTYILQLGLQNYYK